MAVADLENKTVETYQIENNLEYKRCHIKFRGLKGKKVKKLDSDDQEIKRQKQQIQKIIENKTIETIDLKD